MKQCAAVLFFFTSISLVHATTMLPDGISDELLKTSSINLLINNVNENYKVTSLTSARGDSEGFELAAGFVTIIKASDNTCMKIAAALRADTCTSATNCTLQAYALDCNKDGLKALNEKKRMK